MVFVMKHHCRRNLVVVWDPPTDKDPKSPSDHTIHTVDGFSIPNPFFEGPFPPPILPRWEPKPNNHSPTRKSSGSLADNHDINGHSESCTESNTLADSKTKEKVNRGAKQEPICCDGCKQEITWATKTY